MHLRNPNLVCEALHLLHRVDLHCPCQVRVQNEQFIELFDTDLVHLPPEAPKYLLNR